MEISIPQIHNKDTFLQASARCLERAAFYGIRSLMILYMVGDVVKMSYENAASIYSWFTISLFVTPIIGALIGDFLLGNKNTLIIGLLLQSIGAFCFCLPFSAGIYIALAFISLGSGFSSPNMLARFGKLYLHKTKLLDSGFSIFYGAVSLGAFLGTICMSFVMMYFGTSVAFFVCGIVILLSILLSVISKEPTLEIEAPIQTSNLSERIVKITISVLVVGIYWMVYEITYFRIFDLQQIFSQQSSIKIPIEFWSGFGAAFTIPICIIMSLVWTFMYSTQFTKLAIGFIVGAVAYGLILFNPGSASNEYLILYIISVFLLSIAEIYISSIINSVLTQYTNPKYLTLMMALSYLPGRLLSSLFTYIAFFKNQPVFALLFGVAVMAIIGIGLLIYVLANKKQKTLSQNEI